jgi:hypothetical protein
MFDVSFVPVLVGGWNWIMIMISGFDFNISSAQALFSAASLLVA